MLAFERRNGRLVELHILTGKPPAQPAQEPEPLPVRRWVRPGSRVLRPKHFPPHLRVHGRPYKPTGRRRLVQGAQVRARHLHRFYQPQNSQKPVVPAPPEMPEEELRMKTCGLLRAAAGLQGGSFMPVLESGMDDGLPYYITHLNDGEFVQEYVRRRGALPAATALALVKQLLKDLAEATGHEHLLTTLRLERVLVTTQEEEFLQLRAFDYGFSQQGASPQRSPLVRDVCQLLFLLMTGQPYEGGNPENFGVMAELPSALRFIIRQVLTRPSENSMTIKTLRTEVREALCSLVNLAQARNLKSLLVADDSTLPMSHVQHLLLGNIPLKTLFGASFRIEHPELAGCHPFAIPAVNVSGAQAVTLHLLPPERIVSHSDFSPLPTQAWRQDPARQPHLLHMLNHWQGPDWAFLSEAREPGMSLSSLMARRGTLNPVEVTLLLQQIQAGLDQALETGVQRVNLDPAGIQLCVGYDGPVLPRDLERLHQKRLDVWPKFMVKLRLHKTMRSLCRPQLIDPGLGDFGAVQETDVIAAREERQRSLVCLAAHLLSGEGRMRSIAEFPACVPASAAAYLHECLQAVFCGAPLASTADFTKKLCQLLTTAHAEADDDGEAPAAAAGEVESAGFVSDFEEDWPAMDAEAPAAAEPRHIPVAPHIRSFGPAYRPVRSEFHFPWMALSATILLLGTLAWMILGELPSASQAAVPTVIFPSKRHKEPSRAQLAAEVSAPEREAAAPPARQTQPVMHREPTVAAIAPSAPAPSEALAETAAPPAPLPVPDAQQALAATAPAPAVPAADAPQVENASAAAMASVSAPEPSIVAAANPPVSLPALETETVTIRRAVPLESEPQPAQASIDTATVPSPPASVSQEAAVTRSPEPLAASAPVGQSAEAEATPAVTIRHAIMLSPEEMRQTMQPQKKSRKRRNSKR